MLRNLKNQKIFDGSQNSEKILKSRISDIVLISSIVKYINLFFLIIRTKGKEGQGKMQAEEKFLLSLGNARKSLETADHLTYMTFPIVRENRLLLKILEEIYSSIISTINAILQYEYTYKRIEIYKEARENFRTFKDIAGRYKITQEQLNKLIEILSLAEKHKKSPFEFAKNDKIVIMSDSLKTDTLTLDKIKFFLLETKDLLRKATLAIKG